jgi:hypothetical protein
VAIRIGDAGVALSSLHPQGLVQVNGRRYHARAEHGTVALDGAVLIVGGDHLGLLVCDAAAAGPPAGLKGYGERVYSSFLERLADKEVRDDGEREVLRAARRQRGLVWAATLGAVAAVAVLWLVWDYVTDESGPTWQAALTVVVAGAASGAAVFLSLHEGLARFDGGSGRVVAACTGLALIGGMGGAAMGIPAFGLAGGLSLALVATLALALAIPMFLVIGQDVGQ